MFSLTSLCLRKIDHDIIPLNIDIKICCYDIAPNVAAEYGHLECLKYAYKNKSYFDSELCEIAAVYGYLDS